jgi:hypothetical protein
MSGRNARRLLNRKRPDRNFGSSIAAYVLGAILLATGIWWLLTPEMCFSWHRYRGLIDGIACVISATILLWWAISGGRRSSHKEGSDFKIGGESVGMIIGVLGALIAIFAMVDTAAFNESQSGAVCVERSSRPGPAE